MDYRKLISFGKSSFVISLPKSWLVKHNLKKGGIIYVNEEGTELKLSPNLPAEENTENSIKIDITGKSNADIRREIITAYIGDCRTVTLVGADIQANAVFIRNILHNLMAMEIMEQTSTKIVARDFLDIKNISIPNMIRKMDLITRAMITDSKRMFEPELEKNVSHRDEDVNRMNYLILKVLRRALKHSSVAKTIKLNSLEIYNSLWVSSSIERIADQAKRIVRLLSKTKPVPALKKDIALIYESIETFYIEVLKAYHEKSPQKAFENAKAKEDLHKRCLEFSNKYRNNPEISKVAEKLHSMVLNIHEIGRVVYTP